MNLHVVTTCGHKLTYSVTSVAAAQKAIDDWNSDYRIPANFHSAYVTTMRPHGCAGMLLAETDPRSSDPQRLEDYIQPDWG